MKKKIPMNTCMLRVRNWITAFGINVRVQLHAYYTPYIPDEYQG